MGCWNGTCGLTNLAIKAGEKVDFLIIINQIFFTDASGFCYLTGYASPITFLMSGSYNDYGSVEDIDDTLSSKLFLDFFRRGIKSENIKVTPESYYDKEDFGDNPIDYTKLDIEQVINIIERDRVNMKQTSYIDDKEHLSNIGLLMFNKKILSDIIPHKDIPKMNEYILKEIESSKYTFEILKDKDIKGIRLNRMLYSTFYRKFDNLRIFSSSNYLHSDTFEKEIPYILQEKNISKISEMFSIIASLVFLMISLRKSWVAQSGKGSQSDNKDTYLKLNNAINSYISEDMSTNMGKEFTCFQDVEVNGVQFKEDEVFECFDYNPIIEEMTLYKDGDKYKISYSDFLNNFEE